MEGYERHIFIGTNNLHIRRELENTLESFKGAEQIDEWSVSFNGNYKTRRIRYKSPIPNKEYSLSICGEMGEYNGDNELGSLGFSKILGFEVDIPLEDTILNLTYKWKREMFIERHNSNSYQIITIPFF